MTDQEKLNLCRYYKGEDKDNTYEDKNKELCARCERIYVNSSDTSNEDMTTDVIIEYIGYGLSDFCMTDNIPMLLKALLANRFFSYNERIDIESFKAFYEKYYNKKEGE